MLKVILSVIFVLICLALIVIILLQEGKSAGLGSISGMADTYWGKNKGRSMEGTLEKFTKAAAVLFMVLAVVLNILWIRCPAACIRAFGLCGNMQSQAGSNLGL